MSGTEALENSEFGKLIVFPSVSNTHHGQIEEGGMAEKPKLEEVLRYAKPNIMKFIGQFAADLPHEQKEEIEQSVYFRLIKAYEGINGDDGWKSFVYFHCRGGVLDYLKFGKGFEETKWSLQKEEEHESRNVSKIKTRIQDSYRKDSESGDAQLEDILNSFGISTKNPDESLTINWELVSHMASQEPYIHAAAKFILGFTIEEIAAVMRLCKARVSQLIETFIERFDDPAHSANPWLLQTIYAFGLSKHFGIPEVDQTKIMGWKVGWTSLPKVDLLKEPTEAEIQAQMTLEEYSDRIVALEVQAESIEVVLEAGPTVDDLESAPEEYDQIEEELRLVDVG